MRVLAVWCPDWPVVAALSEQGSPAKLPAAVFSSNRARATNAAAREFGVRRGMRRRDAQARCPELLVLDDDPDRDARAFETVLGTLESVRPGIAALRPGLAALRVPPRYFGGEAETAAVLAEQVVEAGVWDVRCGIADDLYTAEQAARLAPPQDCRIIPVDGAAGFLAGLGVEVLADLAPGGVELLHRLGLHTLGDLATLPAAAVRDRFGEQVAWVHRVLHGAASESAQARLDTRTPPPDLARHVDFEPPLANAEQVCFSTRVTAESFVAAVAAEGLVCTGVRVEAYADGEYDVPVSARTWLHPRWFSAADLVDRLHWQLQGDRLRSVKDAGAVRRPIGRIRFVPEDVAPEAAHAEGLWGGTDELVERGIARVQGMLGPESVCRVVLTGGRSPADRQTLVPWGERPHATRPVDRPWPGRIPGPAPARVLDPPWPAQVIGDSGRPVVVDPRGMVSDRPARFTTTGEGWLPVAAWAGPWPVDEEWWEPHGRRLARFQLVGVDGRAWLVSCADGTWTVEGAYD